MPKCLEASEKQGAFNGAGTASSPSLVQYGVLRKRSVTAPARLLCLNAKRPDLPARSLSIL